MSEGAELPDRTPLRGVLVLFFCLLLWAGTATWGASTWVVGELATAHMPWRAWGAQVYAAGELPVWAPIGGGRMLAGDAAGLLYPIDVLVFLAFAPATALAITVSFHWLWAALGAATLASWLGRSVSASTFAGLAYGFGGYAVAHLTDLPHFQVFAWSPWLVGLVVRGLSDGGRWWAGAGIAGGLVFLTGHIEAALVAWTVAALVGAWHAVEADEPELVGIGWMLCVALPIALPQLFATWLADAWSTGPALRDTAWTVWPYPGVATLLLALSAGVAKRGRPWWALGAVAILALLVTPRAAMALTLAGSQLAAVGIDRLGGWLRATPGRVIGRVRIVFAGTVVAVGIMGFAWVWLYGSAKTFRSEVGAWLGDVEAAGVLYDQLLVDLAPWEPTVAWPAFYAWLLLGLVLMAARGRLPVGAVGHLAPWVLALDLFRFGGHLNPIVPTETVAQRPPSTRHLLGVPGPFRAAGIGPVPADRRHTLLPSSSGLVWGLEDVGLGGLSDPRMEAFLAEAGLTAAGRSVEQQQTALRANRHLVDLAGVAAVFAAEDPAVAGFEEVWADGEDAHVFTNPGAASRAFAVGCTHSVTEAEALQAVVAQPDLTAVAIVEGEGVELCVPGSAGTVTLERPSTWEWVLRAELDRPGFVVLTERIAPRQQWFVDDQPVAATPADYVFQGVALDAGSHTLRLVHGILPLQLLIVLACAVGGIAVGVFFRPVPEPFDEDEDEVESEA